MLNFSTRMLCAQGELLCLSLLKLCDAATLRATWAELLKRHPAHGDDGSSSVQWNIELVGAAEAWKEGINGSGVVVATIDGGETHRSTSSARICWRPCAGGDSRPWPFFGTQSSGKSPAIWGVWGQRRN